MPPERIVRPPGFDPQKATECNAGVCGLGNSQLPPEQRQCNYMEQTNPFDSYTEEELTTPKWAGWMQKECPFGEIVYNSRTQNKS